MTQIDKIRIYINHNFHKNNFHKIYVTNDDIEIRGQVHIKSGRFEGVCSKTGKFFPFALTPEVECFYLSVPLYQRKQKLEKLSK